MAETTRTFIRHCALVHFSLRLPDDSCTHLTFAIESLDDSFQFLKVGSFFDVDVVRGELGHIDGVGVGARDDEFLEEVEVVSVSEHQEGAEVGVRDVGVGEVEGLVGVGDLEVGGYDSGALFAGVFEKFFCDFFFGYVLFVFLENGLRRGRFEVPNSWLSSMKNNSIRNREGQRYLLLMPPLRLRP